MSQEEFAKDLDYVIEEIRELLLDKNRKYGDSALSPVRILSKTEVSEQIKVRIDDKLSRLANQQTDEDEDVILDLLGYFLILRIAQVRQSYGRSGK